MPIGVGVNQRALITMSPEEVDAFLLESRTMTMCTMNHDGTIHAVAMWYGFIEGRLAIETKAKSQKARNLLRNPMMTCLVEAGERYDELRGVELVGRGELLDDSELVFALGVSHFNRYHGDYDESKRPLVEAMLNKRIVVALDVDRCVSWDHRKLAGL
jgi:nitroimidazol reductase NimA-like FMN-containing flavoprotein (pyridoxamine 5'-phosphate oxidase superfamily)